MKSKFNTFLPKVISRIPSKQLVQATKQIEQLKQILSPRLIATT